MQTTRAKGAPFASHHPPLGAPSCQTNNLAAKTDWICLEQGQRLTTQKLEPARSWLKLLGTCTLVGAGQTPAELGEGRPLSQAILCGTCGSRERVSRSGQLDFRDMNILAGANLSFAAGETSQTSIESEMHAPRSLEKH